MGWGVIERQERGAILTVLNALQPQARASPGAHSFARRAGPALQPRRVVRAVAPRERSAAMKRREKKARRGRRLRRNGDGPEPVSTPTAPRPSSWRPPPRGPGLSRLPPPTPDRAALSHRKPEMRDPGRGPAQRSCSSGAAL